MIAESSVGSVVGFLAGSGRLLFPDDAAPTSGAAGRPRSGKFRRYRCPAGFGVGYQPGLGGYVQVHRGQQQPMTRACSFQPEVPGPLSANASAWISNGKRGGCRPTSSDHGTFYSRTGRPQLLNWVNGYEVVGTGICSGGTYRHRVLQRHSCGGVRNDGRRFGVPLIAIDVLGAGLAARSHRSRDAG
jgi:hypothetical protein